MGKFWGSDITIPIYSKQSSNTIIKKAELQHFDRVQLVFRQLEQLAKTQLR